MTLRLFDMGAAVACVGLLVAFVTASVRNARALYVAEPLPSARTTAGIA
jgi:hypothetical protein